MRLPPPLLLMSLGTCLLQPGVRDMSIARATAAPPAAAAPTADPKAAPLSRALSRRVELWRKPGTGAGLSARYRLTRRSSLLHENLTTEGTLELTLPDRLELRDDGKTGATTRLIGGALTISANDPQLPPVTTRGADTPGARWLQSRLLTLLTARDVTALRASTSLRVSYGYGLMGLELSPPPGHPARGEIHDLRIQLDPETGEIFQLVLGETSGDVVTINLGEHRRLPAPAP